MHQFVPLPEHRDALILTPDGTLELHPTPMPKLGPGQVLLRLLAAGIDPYELHPGAEARRLAGSPVAEVAAIGDSVQGWGAPDRVLLTRLGGADYGFDGLASYMVASAADLDHGSAIRLPVDLPLDDATLLPAAARAVRVLRVADIPKGGALAVIGLELVGLITILLARHQRVDRIVAADTSPTLRSKAEWCGATRMVRLPDDSFADAIVRGAGSPGLNAALVLLPDAQLVHQAVEGLAPHGALILGAPSPRSFLLAFPAVGVQQRDLRILGVRSIEESDLRDAMRAVRQGVLNSETLITRRVAWPDVPGAGLSPAYWEHGSHVLVEAPPLG